MGWDVTRRTAVWVLLAMLAAAWIPSATAQQADKPSDAVAARGATDAPEAVPTDSREDVLWPMVILAIGVLVVLGLIIGMKINAFIALITAAMVVSLLAPGSWAEKISRVAEAFGSAAGKIGIVIALAAVIGKCMLDSGAADRIVRSFLRLFGEKRAPMALMGSGFVLAIPVFFDTVFYLLVPLARSLHRKTGVNYLLYVLAIGAGGAITHTLVPPTPGPLIMAAALGFPIGIMLLVGLCVALPAAFVALLYARVLNRVMQVPMRQIGSEPEPKPLHDTELPSLLLSLLPVVLPVILITMNTVLDLLVKGYATAGEAPQVLLQAFEISAIVGNANFALLLSAVIAILTLYKQRGLSRGELAGVVEVSLMSGGVIILITAGGGAFGAMLKEAGVGEAIETLFSDIGAAGIMILLLGFCVAAVLKIAQGSSTVAMITGSGMLAGIANPSTLGFHPVYLATAIGAGSLVGSWMNDSGFWIFAKMSGLTEIEALKSWTTTLLVLAFVSLAVTVLLAILLPDPLAFITPPVAPQ